MGKTSQKAKTIHTSKTNQWVRRYKCIKNESCRFRKTKIYERIKQDKPIPVGE